MEPLDPNATEPLPDFSKEKKCQRCGKTIEPGKRRRKFCSTECGREASREKHRDRYHNDKAYQEQVKAKVKLYVADRKAKDPNYNKKNYARAKELRDQRRAEKEAAEAGGQVLDENAVAEAHDPEEVHGEG